MPTNIADAIRSKLHSVVSQRSSVDSSSDSIQESTLIRNGMYCGRRFRLMGYNLIWFQEEGQIKLFSPDGGLDVSCTLAQFCSMATDAPFEIRRAA
ncbi:MAG: hypothetical protein ABL921_01320 [Pirellula sp.]